MATIGKISPYAKGLRRRATDAEQRLWYHLRARRLGGFKFRRQETIGRYVADFACPRNAGSSSERMVGSMAAVQTRREWII